MTLAPGERVLVQSGPGTLVLTTHRIRLDGRQDGQRKLVSMTLDAVATCGLVARTFPLLLVLAVLLAAGGFVVARDGDTSSANGLKVAAVVVAILFLATRTAVLEITSAGESITVSARGKARGQIVEFVDEVEAAKLAYLGKLPTA